MNVERMISVNPLIFVKLDGSIINEKQTNLTDNRYLSIFLLIHVNTHFIPMMTWSSDY